MSGVKGNGEVGRRKVVWQASPFTRERKGLVTCLPRPLAFFFEEEKGLFTLYVHVFFFPKNAGNSHFRPFITL